MTTTAHVISLDKDNFGVFMDMISILSKACDDLVIKNGIICQKSNKRSLIMQVDMTHILGDVDLLMSNIPIKEKLLTPFRRQGAAMDLIINNDGYEFQEQESKINFKKPLENYLTNKYMPVENLATTLNIDDNGKILDREIGKHLIERVPTLTEALGATLIQVDFQDRKASYKIRPADTNSTTVGTLMVVEDLEQEIEGFCAFPVEPFQVNVDSFDSQMWYTHANSDGDRNVIMRLDAFVDGGQNVPMTLWSLSQIKSLDELT